MDLALSKIVLLCPEGDFKMYHFGRSLTAWRIYQTLSKASLEKGKIRRPSAQSRHYTELRRLLAVQLVQRSCACRRMFRTHAVAASRHSSSQALSCARNYPQFYGSQHSQQPATCRILSQINPVHALPSYFFKIHYNIILPSKPRPSKWSYSFTFPH